MERSTAETIVKVYSILFWIEAAILAVMGLALTFFGSLMSGMMGSAAGMMLRSPNPFIIPFMGAIGIVAGIVVIFLAVIYLLVGQHLWKHDGWARIAAIVLCILMLPSFPGLIIGGFGIWFFGFQPDVNALFHSDAKPVRQSGTRKTHR